jgi:hypothetical protein
VADRPRIRRTTAVLVEADEAGRVVPDHHPDVPHGDPAVRQVADDLPVRLDRQCVADLAEV